MARAEQLLLSSKPVPRATVCCVIDMFRIHDSTEGLPRHTFRSGTHPGKRLVRHSLIWDQESKEVGPGQEQVGQEIKPGQERE